MMQTNLITTISLRTLNSGAHSISELLDTLMFIEVF